MAVTERGETALAQIVLAAQKRAEAEAERDEDSLPSFVWNEIRESARVQRNRDVSILGGEPSRHRASPINSESREDFFLPTEVSATNF